MKTTIRNIFLYENIKAYKGSNNKFHCSHELYRNNFIRYETICNNKVFKILIFLVIPLLSKESANIILKSKSSYIIAIINGIGKKKVFYSGDNTRLRHSFFPPDEIQINGINQSTVHFEYTINVSRNNIKLIWHNKITSIRCFFYNCPDLVSVNRSNFNFDELEEMSLTFGACISLKTFEFPKTKTPKLKYIGSMFLNCKSLISVDLSYLNTENIVNMDNLFSNCISLTSINLSHFDISKIERIESMFRGCSNLEYINLKNAKETTGSQFIFENVFKGTPDNIVICINKTNAPKLTGLIESKDQSCYTIDCSNNWKSIRKKIKNGDVGCIDNCKNNNKFQFEFNNICQENCQYGSYYDENNSVTKCKCELDKCLLCPTVEPVKNLCISCNESYYPKENDETNIGPYINCYKDLEGYYIDKSNNNYIYKLCYERCETCLIKGDYYNHNCEKCNSNYTFEITNKNNYKNCYIKCSYYYYFDKNGNYKCTEDSSCPEEFSKLQIDSRECIKNCSLDKSNKFEFRNECYKSCPKDSIESVNKANYCEAICNEKKPFVIINTQDCVEFCDIELTLSKKCILKYKKELDEKSDVSNNNEGKNIEEIKAQEIKEQDKMLESIEKGFTSNNFNTSNIENGNDAVIEDKKMKITLTTTDNQKSSNKNNNVTTINLGECENILRKAYNIPIEEKVYMKK